MARRKPKPSRPRRAPNKEPKRRVLIFCVGTKTEPMYFRAIARHLGLNGTRIVVRGSSSSPSIMINEAISERIEERRAGESYDDVFCVFDRDEFPDFDKASNLAESKALRTIRTWPCFEYWFLLHFEYSQRAYTRTGDNSPCENCISDLKKYLPKYEKDLSFDNSVFFDNLCLAISRAEIILEESKKFNSNNPSTEVHTLVKYLISLRD